MCLGLWVHKHACVTKHRYEAGLQQCNQPHRKAVSFCMAALQVQNGEGSRVRAVQFNGIYSCIRHRGTCLVEGFPFDFCHKREQSPNHDTVEQTRHTCNQVLIRKCAQGSFKADRNKTSQMKVYGFAFCSPVWQSESVCWLNRPPLFDTVSRVTSHHQF